MENTESKIIFNIRHYITRCRCHYRKPVKLSHRWPMELASLYSHASCGLIKWTYFANFANGLLHFFWHRLSIVRDSKQWRQNVYQLIEKCQLYVFPLGQVLLSTNSLPLKTYATKIIISTLENSAYDGLSQKSKIFWCEILSPISQQTYKAYIILVPSFVLCPRGYMLLIWLKLIEPKVSYVWTVSETQKELCDIQWFLHGISGSRKEC